ncbi:glycoside hydrolase family 3 protein [Nocardiopsis ganjiahuensis]|uniref:glycoside hydrolase family 3 protein n=1 Tax=Nocardiopsis ganjiahuensis TaxID=239984 RepID=UPI00034A5663|nr:glycoside hydrolase family 3 protein [Nocardiopsis ganjiahuensis]
MSTPHHRRQTTEERVEDLLRSLTPEERLGLLHQHQAPIERLGIPAFRTGTEALHGLAWLGEATVFPQAVGLAAAWDPDLLRRVGEATATELLAVRRRDPGAGPNVWAPVVNPLRDPRWGRNEEGYSEDPWLTGLLATAYARGLAGDGPRPRTAPTVKHFLGYNNETDRCTTSSDLPPRVLREYELPAHLPALREGAAVAVMPSYNLVNGRPAHLSPLINRVLRRAAPDRILVVSDAHAPANLFGLQGFHPDAPTAYAHALRAGLDSFTQDDDRPEATLAHLRAALDRGLIGQEDVDEAVRNVLSVRIRLGEFDPEPPAEEVPEAAVNSPEHRALAREAATRSLTLLRNDGLLPLRAPLRIAVVGQLGDTVLEDWYSGTLPYAVTARQGLAEHCEVEFVEGTDRITLETAAGPVVLDAEGRLRVPGGPERSGEPAGFDLFDWGGGAHALRSADTGRYVDEGTGGALACTAPGPGTWEVRQTFRLAELPDGRFRLVQVHTGRAVTVADDGGLRVTDGDAPEEEREGTAFRIHGFGSGARAAAEAASRADAAVVVAGDHPMVNGRETEDRADLDLPAAQERVLKAVHGANPATVLVLSSGYPYAVTWADEHVPAIVWSAHGGQEYGNALADVLLGRAEPAGRLTQTWYRDTDGLPDLLDYDIITSGGTYLYFDGTPLYPFGHGLGYASVEYGRAEVTVSGGRVTVEVPVTNTGDRTAEEVVQVYTRQLASRVRQPARSLRGFARLRIEPGAVGVASVSFAVDRLAVWDTIGDRFVVEEAPREVLVGRSALDIAATAPLRVPGERIPPRDASTAWSADRYDDASGIRLCPVTPEPEPPAPDAPDSAVPGDAVRSRSAGAWAAYRDVDLGDGATECRVAVNAPRAATVRLRLDAPDTGPVIGEVAVPESKGAHDFTEVRSPLSGASGVRDLYVVLEDADTAVAELALGAP